MSASENLHPIFDRVVSRADKEARLRQRAKVIWFYGLSGSGKSTLAVALERQLIADGFTTHLLDGDNVRTGLNHGLGFSEADRAENIRRVAEVAKLFTSAGLVTLCSFITPLRSLRASARQILGDDLIEVYVKASFDTCAKRDPKGLYAKAAAGGVAQFTGRDSGFEEPLTDSGAWVIDTEAATLDVCVRDLRARLIPLLSLP